MQMQDEGCHHAVLWLDSRSDRSGLPESGGKVGERRGRDQIDTTSPPHSSSHTVQVYRHPRRPYLLLVNSCCNTPLAPLAAHPRMPKHVPSFKHLIATSPLRGPDKRPEKDVNDLLTSSRTGQQQQQHAAAASSSSSLGPLGRGTPQHLRHGERVSLLPGQLGMVVVVDSVWLMCRKERCIRKWRGLRGCSRDLDDLDTCARPLRAAPSCCAARMCSARRRDPSPVLRHLLHGANQPPTAPARRARLSLFQAIQPATAADLRALHRTSSV